VREVALGGEEGGGIGGKMPPSVFKKPWFQNKHWGTLTNSIWPIILNKHSINLLTPQPHFLFFKASLPVKNWRVSKNLFNFQKLIYCKNNKEELELSNYFWKLIFSQQTAAPQKVPLWALSLQGSSLVTPLVLHLVHQLPLREFVLSWVTCGLITEAECESPCHQ